MRTPLHRNRSGVRDFGLLLKAAIACLQISLLQTDHNPDIMLLAARSLTHLADNLPTSCSSIVRHGGVPALCERLLNIEYIDLAEQSLQVRPLPLFLPLRPLRSGLVC